MADQTDVGGFKLEGSTVRTPNGGYHSTLTFTLTVNPEEQEAALAAGRKLVAAFLNHFQECESMAEGFAKLFGSNSTAGKPSEAPANDNGAAVTPPATDANTGNGNG